MTKLHWTSDLRDKAPAARTEGETSICYSTARWEVAVQPIRNLDQWEVVLYPGGDAAEDYRHLAPIRHAFNDSRSNCEEIACCIAQAILHIESEELP